MEQLIGLKIRKVREIRNYSQDYVAGKLSVSQSTYSDMENGKLLISREKLKQIADILGVTPEVIENFSEQMVFNNCVQSGISNTYHISNPIEKINELYGALVEQLKSSIIFLEKENERLQQELKNLKEKMQ